MSVPADATATTVLPQASTDPAGLLRLFGIVRELAPDRTEDRPYREFLEALGVAVYTTDADGRITFFNEAAVDLWGRRPTLGEEWCGSLRLFHLDGKPMAHAACPMAIALTENRPVRGAAAIAERPDGRRVTFVPYPTPLRDAEGELVGAVNVLVDVTERRRAEDQLRQTADALRASNAVKDEFLGLVSHELRTPVTTIFGNAEILVDRPGLGEAERLMIADMAEESERLLRIVENLLQLTKLGSGTVIDVEPQVLSHVVRAAVGSYHRHHPDRRIRFTSRAQSAVVDAEATSVELVVHNLLSNADKYSPPTQPIDVVVRADDREVSVVVLDRGIGVSAAEAEQVFTAFFRTEQAKRSANGIGVGLTVCVRIVEAQGGRIWMRPRDGGGTEVGFAMPRTSDVLDEVPEEELPS